MRFHRRPWRPQAALGLLVVGCLLGATLVAPAGPVAGTRFTWRIETLDDSGNAGRHSSLVIAANGTEYVLYQDDDGSAIRLATSLAGTWSSELVAGPGAFAGDTNLVLDSRGGLHASYYDAVSGYVRYATRASPGGPWNAADVDVGHFDGFNRLALDALDSPRIAYQTFSDTLRYARLSGSTWIHEDIDPSSPGADYVAFALDTFGNPHIAYSGPGQLRYATKPGASWVIDVIDPRGYVGQFASMALDDAGRPHVAYYDEPGARMWYATHRGVGWSRVVVDSQGNPGRGTSLVVGADGRPRVAYYAQFLGELRYAEMVNGTWELQTADDESTVGWEPSLALDGAMIPHVTYYDWTRGALREAVGTTLFGARTVGFSEATGSSAVLRGELTSLDGFRSANASFEWRPRGTLVWENATPLPMTDAGSYETNLSGLAPGAQYEYRALVEAGGVVAVGRILILDTVRPTPVDLTGVLLLAVGAGIAIVGISLATLVWLRGPGLFKRRGGRRPGGPA